MEMPDSSLTTRNDLQHILQLAKPSILSRKIVQNRILWWESLGEHESNTLQLVDFTGTILILDAFSLLIRASCELGSIWASKRSTAKERSPSKEAPVSPVLPLFSCSLENYDVCFIYSGGFRCLTVELRVCYDSYVLFCISYQKKLSSISEIPKSHSMILKSSKNNSDLAALKADLGAWYIHTILYLWLYGI